MSSSWLSQTPPPHLFPVPSCEVRNPVLSLLPSDISTARSLANADTIYSADCIEFCPFPGYENLLVCGTYQVLEPSLASERDLGEGAEEGQEDADEAEGEPRPRQTERTGRLLLYRVGEDEASMCALWRT